MARCRRKPGSIVADDPTLNNPIYLLVESKGKFLYVANQGNNAQGTNAQSGLAGYVVDPSTHQLSFIAGEPFGSGAGLSVSWKIRRISLFIRPISTIPPSPAGWWTRIPGC